MRNYAIECDLQISKDGEAMVFHDDTIDRLLEGVGPVRQQDASSLRQLKFKSCADRIQTLGELLDQVDAKVPLIIELKSHWDYDPELPLRVLNVIKNYRGPYALMSFDPDMIACIAERAPGIVRGITADRVTDAYYEMLSLKRRLSLRNFSHLPRTKPHFVSFDFNGLPFSPVTAIRKAGHPVISWTINSPADSTIALRYSDQITFQGYHPA